MLEALEVLGCFIVVPICVVGVWALVKIHRLQKQCDWLTRQCNELNRWRTEYLRANPAPHVSPAAPSAPPVAAVVPPAPAVSEKAAARERIVFQTPAAPVVTAVRPPVPPAPAPTPPVPPPVPAPVVALPKLSAMPMVAHVPPPLPPVAPPNPPAPVAPAAPAPHLPPPVPPVSPRPPAPPVTREKIGLEELLSTRILVWVAGIAAALAGVYFVQESIQRGLVSPPVRVLLATGFGIGLLALGQWRRRPNANIAQAVSAAGVADLFACIFACNHYHLMGMNAPLAFALMAGVTALAVVLSLQQGPFVAALGLIGGFLTPAMVEGTHGGAGGLFGYLFMLQIGLLAITRIRGWSILAALTVLGSTVWVLLWMTVIHPYTDPQYAPFLQGDAPVLGLFVLGAVAATMVTSATSKAENTWAGKHIAARLLTWGATLVGLVFVAALLGLSRFSNLEWGFVGLLVAGCLTLGRLRAPYEGLAWLASALVLGLLVTGVMSERGPMDVGHWGMLMAVFGVLMAGGTYGASWGAPVPVRWVAASAVSALGYLALAYLTLGTSPRSEMWAVLAVGVGAVYGAAAVPAVRRRQTAVTGEATLMVLLGAAATALILAVPMALDHAWLTAVWSVLIPAFIFGSLRLKVPALRFFAVLVAALAVVRMLAAPVMDPAGTGMYLNWWSILAGYGVPVLSFGVAGYLLRGTKNGLASFFEAAPMALALAFTSLLVRRYFHHESLLVLNVEFWEAGTYAIIWLLLGWSFTAAGLRHGRPLLRAGGHAILVIAFGVTAAGLAGILNPAWARAIGPYAIFNPLLYVYGLPIFILAMVGVDLQRRGDGLFARGASGLAQILLTLLAGLEIRHGFHRADLWAGDVTFVEMGTYTVGTLVTGWGLFGLGQRFRALVALPLGEVIVAVGVMQAVLAQVAVLYSGWAGEIGSGLIINPMLYVYGLPLLLVLVMGADLRRCGEKRVLPLVSAAGLALLFAFLTVEVRHGFHRFESKGLMAWGLWFVEMGTYTVTWLVLGGGLAYLGQRFGRVALVKGGQAILMIGLAQAVVAQALVLNAGWAGEIGSTLIWNPILYVYGLPMGLILLMAGVFRRRGEKGVVAALGGAGLALLWAFLTVEIRHGYHRFETEGVVTWGLRFVEMGTYTVAWLGLGGGLGYFGENVGEPLGEKVLARAGRVIFGIGLVQAVAAQVMVLAPRLRVVVQAWPVFNELGYVYAVPVGMILVAAWYLWKREERGTLFEVTLGVGAGLVTTLLTLEVRHWYHLADLRAWDLRFAELGSYPALWLTLGWVMARLGERWKQGILTMGGRGLLGLGLVMPVAMQTVVVNPRGVAWDVGRWPVLNGLLYVYGLPALLGGVLAVDFKRRGNGVWSRLAGGVGLVLVFMLITLEVRQGFQGAVLNGAHANNVEMLTYDLVWLVLAFGLMSAGIPLRSAMLRWASLILMIVTVGKVFIVDAAAAKLSTDLRVLALVGLAGTLLSIAYLYTRFVFKRPAGAGEIPPVAVVDKQERGQDAAGAGQ